MWHFLICKEFGNPLFSGFILQKDTVQFVPQIKHCPHKINYSERDYNQRCSLKRLHLKGIAE